MSARAILFFLALLAVRLNGGESAPIAAPDSALPFHLLNLAFVNGKLADQSGNAVFVAPPQIASDSGRDVLQLEKDSCPLRLTRPFEFDRGAVRVRIKFLAGRAIPAQGAHLIDLYAAPPLSFHGNRTSRLTMHIYPFSKWSPSSCTVFFILYDRVGNQPGHTLNFVCRANFENDRWYEFGANWDLAQKTGGIFIDGVLQSGELRFPSNWQGTDTAGLLTLGDSLTRVAEADLFPQSVSLRDEE